MSTMPSQLTSINQKIERRTNKSFSTSKLNKDRSFRKIVSNHHLLDKTIQTPTKRVFNDNQISLQISKEMKLIQQLLNQTKPQLEEIEQKTNDLTIMELLFDLEEKIKRKNYQLTQINNENKELKSTSKKALRYSTNNDSQEINPQGPEDTFKLAHELKQQREELAKVRSVHLEKKSQLQLIKSECQKMESEYIERCKKTREKPLTYEMFKSLNEEKKKELKEEVQSEERKGRKRERVKEMLNVNNLQQTQTKNSQKDLKEIVNRKKIAEQALKTAKKKYNQEISEFYAKLQFLREEDLALVQTLREKEVEFYGLENKFNEAKKYGTGKVSQYHKFGETLRFKGDYEDMEEMRRTRKSPGKFNSAEHL